MICNQYPYDLFNPAYIAGCNIQQMKEQRTYWEQQKKIGDMVRAIHDYFDAARDIEPEYRQQAIDACCAEIAAQVAAEQQRNGGQWQ